MPIVIMTDDRQNIYTGCLKNRSVNWYHDKLEIPEIISGNVFLCKNFHYCFVNELLTKKHWPITERIVLWNSDDSVGCVLLTEHEQIQAIHLEESILNQI